MEPRELLEAISRKMIADPDVSSKIPDDVRQSGWLGFSPCSLDQIAEAESRLNVTLPPSLRAFYEITNGWRSMNSFVDTILPIERIDYLPKIDPGLIEAIHDSTDEIADEDPEYFDEQVTRVIRSIVLSTEGDATTTLIDPFSSLSESEWNVGAWASWHPAMEWSDTNWWGYLQQQLAR